MYKHSSATNSVHFCRDYEVKIFLSEEKITWGKHSLQMGLETPQRNAGSRNCNLWSLTKSPVTKCTAAVTYRWASWCWNSQHPFGLGGWSQEGVHPQNQPSISALNPQTPHCAYAVCFTLLFLGKNGQCWPFEQTSFAIPVSKFQIPESVWLTHKDQS